MSLNSRGNGLANRILTNTATKDIAASAQPGLLFDCRFVEPIENNQGIDIPRSPVSGQGRKGRPLTSSSASLRCQL
jgi:hypothetical protein